MSTFATIAGHELRSALRGRIVPGFAALFGGLALALALGGLGATGQLLVQGFTRTAVSLLNLSLYLLPLLGLLMGATAFAREDGTELLLAQPVSRIAVLLGRFAGLAAALATVAAAGFGAAALLVAIRVGPAGLIGYLLVGLGTAFVALAGLGIGLLVGIAANRRATAVGAALAIWFAAAVLYDLVAITLIQVAGSGQVGGWLLALLAVNPIDGARTLGLVALGADVLLGPAGAALQKLLAAGGAVWILTSLGVWLIAPLGAAAVLFERRDF